MSTPVIVILAGGSAKRLKDLSENFSSKQFLTPNFSEDSFLQSTIKRALKLTSLDKIIVIGNVGNKSLLQKQIPSGVCLLLEQESNNTGFAVYLSALFVSKKFIDLPIFIWPSDHHINMQDEFLSEIEYAYKNRSSDAINIFGVATSSYNQEFGYIKHKDDKVLGFFEKPSKEFFIENLTDNSFINSGLFLADSNILLSSFDFSAEVKFEELSDNCHLISNTPIPANQQISFDKLVLQNSSNLHMHEISNFWLDIGNWRNLWQLGDEEKLSFKLESDEKRIESDDYIFDLKNDILNIYKKDKSDMLV